MIDHIAVDSSEEYAVLVCDNEGLAAIASIAKDYSWNSDIVALCRYREHHQDDEAALQAEPGPVEEAASHPESGVEGSKEHVAVGQAHESDRRVGLVLRPIVEAGVSDEVNAQPTQVNEEVSRRGRGGGVEE